ncbi:MAG TPA: MFS transporter [Mesorhizobium sp.]|jgi:MFS family permease|nr:MFS transporter [Mesorhizobium sp.]
MAAEHPAPAQVPPVDWSALWRSGDLGRFCFISSGILLHATNETMVATIMPALVRDLSGVEMVGWSLSLYELGAIAAGAAAGRLISYLSLRATMIVAALLFATGAGLCATAPTMPLFLLGRVIEGLGGGGLMGLAFVSVERLFPRAIWPKLFAIISAIWGVAAFSGPLLGALFAEYLSWRAGFGLFTICGLLVAGLTLLVLRRGAALQPVDGEAPPFPFLPLACLVVGVTLIAASGVAPFLRAALLFAAGVVGLILFFVIDGRQPRSRLFPSGMFRPDTALGSGMIMMGSLSVATCSFFIYGPLILTTLHGISVLTTGYVIAAESIAWSLLSILVANAPPARERLLIFGGALMIAGGLAGFAYAVPSGSIPLILFCALLQGGGFGIAWPFATRLVVASARPDERTVAASGVSALQRIGYAAGAALCGIVANAAGFSEGLSGPTAAAVAPWLFLAFVPLALIGVAAAWRLTTLAATPAELARAAA